MLHRKHIYFGGIVVSVLYFLFALLGLSLLILIHEFGHYFMARREGMRVEVFSIGFGKPIFSWIRRGVKWQICPFLLGGYVRIAGLDGEAERTTREMSDGFYAKRPWSRIKVALAGPLVNLLFALLLFTLLWILGGREKSFSQITRLVGSVDRQSELYRQGMRPGDELLTYNGRIFHGFEDLMYTSLSREKSACIEGNRIDYFAHDKSAYRYRVIPYETPLLPKGMRTIGLGAPASYLIYRETDPLFPGHPLFGSGIKDRDRIVWADGELIFSDEQLGHILDMGRLFIHYERDGAIFTGTIPRLPIHALEFSLEEYAELGDAVYAAGLHTHRDSPFYIPYILTDDLIIRKAVDSLPAYSPVEGFQNPSEHPLLREGDRIIAVDGVPVKAVSQLLEEVQMRKVQIIVQRKGYNESVLWKDGDRLFREETDWSALVPLISSIGTQNRLVSHREFHLLTPITPIQWKNFPFSERDRGLLLEHMEKQRAQIGKISDSETKEDVERIFNSRKNRYILGILLRDRPLIYNPDPIAQFSAIFQEVARNITAMISGNIKPKHFGGPLMIVRVLHQSWNMGIEEALFWLGVVSFNLGLLNLLPIPMLDGGHISFSLIESIRKKPIGTKAMRRIITPVALLLIFFFAYITFCDILRFFA